MSEIAKLPTTVDRASFLDHVMSGERICFYTDWILKLQEVGRPVGNWIKSQLNDVHKIKITSWQENLQSILPAINWPQLTPKNLFNISEILIDRYAVPEIPSWVFSKSDLHKLSVGISSSAASIKDRTLPLRIPAELATKCHLRTLEVKDSHLFTYSIDPEFCQNIYLTFLDLDATGLQSNLDDLGRFPNLTTLRLYSSHPLPSYSFLASLKKLKSLQLQTQLDSLPKEIRHLTALESLFVSHNHLTDLPEEMQHLSSLETLSLSCNKFDDLPEWLNCLSSLRKLEIDPFPSYYLNRQHENFNPLTDFPPSLRHCHSLYYVTLGVPIRSLANLPPIARYWAALAFTYPETEEIYNLPRAVHDAVKREFDPIFQPHISRIYIGEIIRSQDNLKHLKISPYAGYVYMTKGTERACIICGESPITGICSCCGVDNRLAPAFHPQLMAWLEMFYGDSYETLFDRVRTGESLAEPLFSRFLHETTRHHYQLLFNTASVQLDPLLSDELTQKFSIPFTDSTKIIL